MNKKANISKPVQFFAQPGVETCAKSCTGCKTILQGLNLYTIRTYRNFENLRYLQYYI